MDGEPSIYDAALNNTKIRKLKFVTLSPKFLPCDFEIEHLDLKMKVFVVVVVVVVVDVCSVHNGLGHFVWRLHL